MSKKSFQGSWCLFFFLLCLWVVPGIIYFAVNYKEEKETIIIPNQQQQQQQTIIIQAPTNDNRIQKRFCSACGAESTGKYCQNCGTEL